MSIGDIPVVQWHRVLDDNETLRVGSFYTSEHEELKYIRHYLYINGAIAGTEKIKTHIYADENYLSKIYSSDWSDLSDIEALGDYWQGFVRVDFAREHLFTAREYWVGLEISGYTRDAFTFFISIKNDYDNAIYPISGKDQIAEYPWSMEIFTYREFRE
jgi:hypothetical protein